MTDESQLEDAYIGLIDTSDTLNVRTIELQHSFDQVEEKLADICLFVTAWADGLIGVRKSKGEAYRFGYCKMRQKWQLVCKKLAIDEDGNYDTKMFEDGADVSYGLLHPINNMSRQIKCEAAELMPNLLDRLQKASGKIAFNVQIAIDNLKLAKDVLDAVAAERDAREEMGDDV